jgi:uncharacterized damage-inducible protein DinB
MLTTDLRYPIGDYVAKEYSDTLKEEWLADIKFLPILLEQAVANLDTFQLETPYRDGGWTVQQLVHHVADSHMNAYCRFKLGYTEVAPIIRPYEEKEWATTPEIAHVPINMSITLLHALHARWHEFLTRLTMTDWQRTVYHPGHQKEFSLWHLLGMYAWHGKHHTAHITGLRERMGW